MMKMESTKSRRLSWLDCFLGPMNSNSKWLQENLEETNKNVGRKLKMIEDSDADSFAEKVEMYNKSRQELNNLVDNCYNHGRGELILNNIPNSGRDISISNVSSRPLLSKLRSSKQPNAPECSVVSKQLKRGVSEKENKYFNGIRIKAKCVLFRKYYSVTESDDDDGKEGSDYELEADLKNMIEKLNDDGKEGSDELEADLSDMIEKLYIQMEWDQVVSMLQHRILRPYMSDDDAEFRQVQETVSSNADKSLLEETLELHSEICRHLNQMSYLEEYNEEINANPKKKCRRIE